GHAGHGLLLRLLRVLAVLGHVPSVHEPLNDARLPLVLPARHARPIERTRLSLALRASHNPSQSRPVPPPRPRHDSARFWVQRELIPPDRHYGKSEALPLG